MSRRDTDAGARWGQVVTSNLASTDYGILVLTPDNRESKWLHFEAGALSKEVSQAHVVPLLFNLKPTDVSMPLAQFQMKVLDRDVSGNCCKV